MNSIITEHRKKNVQAIKFIHVFGILILNSVDKLGNEEYVVKRIDDTYKIMKCMIKLYARVDSNLASKRLIHKYLEPDFKRVMTVTMPIAQRIIVKSHYRELKDTAKRYKVIMNRLMSGE